MLLKQFSGPSRAYKSCVSHRCVQAAAGIPKPGVSEQRRKRDPRAENVPGDFYVDSTCIDCDICRWMAPETYGRANQKSAVVEQPDSPEARQRALLAMLACPTFSIHAKHKTQGELGAALAELPIRVSGTENCYHLVMASSSSYGAVSYLIRRPEGNIMFDSPRFDIKLLKRIQAMGGVKYICLSHRDDVCDHATWAEALGAPRIIHEDECNPGQGTDKAEIKLQGSGPFRLPDESPDLEIFVTPGHTTGHICLHYKPERVLFTGDHWAYSGIDHRGSLLRRFNWYSLEVQMESLEALKSVDFIHVLPAHQRRMSFKTAEAKNAFIDLTIKAEQAESSEPGAGRTAFIGGSDAFLNVGLVSTLE